MTAQQEHCYRGILNGSNSQRTFNNTFYIKK